MPPDSATPYIIIELCAVYIGTHLAAWWVL